MATRCPGCMKLKEKSPVCEHCGYNENVPNYSHQLPVGTKLHGQYTVGKVLGQGGFGITYIGWDDNLDIPLAIKEYYPSGIVSRDNSYSLEVTSTGYNTEIFQNNRERFMREARAMAKLTGIPGIVKIYNYFPENNTAYITMEYVQGTDLKRYIKMQGRPLTPKETFAILRPVMDALSKVHEAGLVHRDISPDNIMIQRDGQAKLLDFGAVREVKDADVAKNLSRSTESILKHGYAPIEQYQRRGNLGPWTDIYALCATVYYCLTQDVPPDAPERMIELAEVAWEKIDGLTEKQMEVFRHGMALLPRDRIISIDQLRQELFPPEPESIPEPEVEPAIPEPPVEETPKHPEPMREQREAVPTVMMLTPQKPEELPAVASPEPKKPSRQELLKQKQERLEAERREKEKQQQRREQARLEAERLERERQERWKKEQLRQEQKKKERQRLEKERRDREKQEKRRLEQERREAEQRRRREEQQRQEEEKQQRRQAQLERRRVRQEQQKAAITEETTTKRPAPSHKPFAILAGLMLVAAIALGAFLASRGPEKTMQDVSVQAPGETVGTTVETAPENTEIAVSVLDVVPAYSPAENPTYAPDAWKNNVMMVRPLMQCKGLEEAEIQSIIFLDTIANVPTEHWDISKEQNGSVLAWENQNGTVKELYIAADGGMDAAESCEYLFSQCTGLKNISFNGFLHTDNAKSMKNMFNNCAMLETMDLSTLDTSKVTTMEGMFYNCSNLTELDLTGLKTANVTTMRTMFYGCSYLQELNLSTLDTHNVTDMRMMFANCSSLQSIDLSNINTAKVTDMSAMFSNCLLLQGIDLSGFDTSQVVTMGSMFSGCQNLEKIDLSNFNTTKVSSMNSMFSTCLKLCEVDLSNFKTGNVIDMKYMFNECRSITKLDLNHFTTDKVRDMQFMFSGCTKLKELDISHWRTWNVESISRMFAYCNNLDDLKIPETSFGYIRTHYKYFSIASSNFMEPGKTINGRPWKEFFQ